MAITHEKQQQIWDEEHKNPYVLLQMDSDEASGGVIQFFDWLKEKGQQPSKGIELGCGKGRNVIGLARLGIEMTGIDFSPSAIKEAIKRAKKVGLENKTSFLVHDATTPWPFITNSFDLAVDCFATTDIETPEGRNFAADEMARILKPGGHLLAYLLSTDDEFHKEMMQISPATERNAFLHPTTGKFEKTFDRDEILVLYDNLKVVEERRIQKVAEYFGKKYNCNHHWMVFEKQ